jgi:hypothetical protein
MLNSLVVVVGSATMPSGIELQDLVRTAHPTFNESPLIY